MASAVCRSTDSSALAATVPAGVVASATSATSTSVNTDASAVSAVLAVGQPSLDVQRTEKRLEQIRRVKEGCLEYRQFNMLCSLGSCTRVPTPDARDRSISKRQWESRHRQWLANMRLAVAGAEGCFFTVSANSIFRRISCMPCDRTPGVNMASVPMASLVPDAAEWTSSQVWGRSELSPVQPFVGWFPGPGLYAPDASEWISTQLLSPDQQQDFRPPLQFAGVAPGPEHGHETSPVQSIVEAPFGPFGPEHGRETVSAAVLFFGDDGTVPTTHAIEPFEYHLVCIGSSQRLSCTLRRTNNVPLGLVLDVLDSDAVFVQEVEPTGAVASLNALAPDRAILPGDNLAAVNGYSDIGSMIVECQSSLLLKIETVRFYPISRGIHDPILCTENVDALPLCDRE